MKLYCYILILLQFLNLFQSYKKDGIYITEGTSLFSSGWDTGYNLKHNVL